MKFIFFSILLFVSVLNFSAQSPGILWLIRSLAYPQAPVGARFISLRPYLSHISTAGYINCRPSANPERDTAIMGPYQQAQFILSPVILDYYHPQDYRYIILQCPNSDVQDVIRKKLSARILFDGPNGVQLLDRGK